MNLRGIGAWSVRGDRGMGDRIGNEGSFTQRANVIVATREGGVLDSRFRGNDGGSARGKGASVIVGRGQG